MLPASVYAQAACILEVTARKAGNVHRFQDFEEETFLDFLLSAAAMCPVLDQAREQGVGRTVLEGVRRTRHVTTTNTNLGIVLLLAPLAAVPPGQPLEAGIEAVLNALTVADARLTYEAIRLARPGALGKATEQDVGAEPTQTLRQVMALAAERDTVARQYANGFLEVLQRGLPILLSGLRSCRSVEHAIILCQLQLLAACPDSLIARKRGPAEAKEAAERASQVLAFGWPETGAGQKAFQEFDAWLRGVGHARNPGATADLVTASLFAALREGKMPLPLPRPWGSLNAS